MLILHNSSVAVFTFTKVANIKHGIPILEGSWKTVKLLNEMSNS